ncbi:MAG TPA: hypothetical protein DCZ94_12330 [Lentisphaeria bacterium]|nr:hypothetical protein [Lentisphaeria bacterium]
MLAAGVVVYAGAWATLAQAAEKKMEDKIYTYLWENSGKPEILHNGHSLDVDRFINDRAWGWINQSEACTKMLHSFNLAASSVQRLSDAMTTSTIQQKHESSTFTRPTPMAPPDSTRRECR